MPNRELLAERKQPKKNDTKTCDSLCSYYTSSAGRTDQESEKYKMKMIKKEEEQERERKEDNTTRLYFLFFISCLLFVERKCFIFHTQKTTSNTKYC